MINFLYIILTINPVLFDPRYLGRARKHHTVALRPSPTPAIHYKLKQGRNDSRRHRHDATKCSPLLPATFSTNLYRSYFWCSKILSFYC